MIRENKKLLAYMGKARPLDSEQYATEQEFSSTHQLIKQGERVASVYILKSGLAKCYNTQDTGTVFIQEFFGEGELFGEVEALNNRACFCSIEAVTDVVVYKLSQEHFRKWLAEDAVFNGLILQAMASKIHYKAIRHSFNQSHRVEENFLRLKNQYPALTEKIAKQDLASYLGVTLRSLNRALKELNQADALMENKNP